MTLFYYKNFSGGGEIRSKMGQKVAFLTILEELPVRKMFLTTLMGLNVISWGGNLAKRPKTKFSDPNFNGYDYDFFHLELYLHPFHHRIQSQHFFYQVFFSHLS